MSQDTEQNKIIEDLYTEMYARLCIYAMNALNDRNLAEEAVQDTFRIACMKIDSLIDSPNRQGWLTNTLKNVIRNIRRSQLRLNRIVATALSINCPSPVQPERDVDLGLYCTSILGKEDFKLIKLVILENHTMLEASKEFGISVEACKKRVQRAKSKLKDAITKNL